MGIFDTLRQLRQESKAKSARIETVGRALKRTRTEDKKEKVSRAAQLLARRTGTTERAAQEYIEARIREKEIGKRKTAIKKAVVSGAKKGYGIFRTLGEGAQRMHGIKPPQPMGFYGPLHTQKPKKKLSSPRYKKKR